MTGLRDVKKYAMLVTRREEIESLLISVHFSNPNFLRIKDFQG